MPGCGAALDQADRDIGDMSEAGRLGEVRTHTRLFGPPARIRTGDRGEDDDGRARGAIADERGQIDSVDSGPAVAELYIHDRHIILIGCEIALGLFAAPRAVDPEAGIRKILLKSKGNASLVVDYQDAFQATDPFARSAPKSVKAS